MADPLHRHLYKYRSLAGDKTSEFVRRIVVEHELHFPRPHDFNDPFDCFPVARTSATRSEIEKHMKRIWMDRSDGTTRQQRRHSFSKAKPKISSITNLHAQFLDHIVSSVGVLSLSEKWDHVLMWSHYADSHRGICLRFRVDPTQPFFMRAFDVKYQAERPILDVIRDNPEQQVSKALLTKADYWSYEEEWRIIEHEKGPGQYRYPPTLLDGIVLGAKISSEDKAKVLGWVEQSASPIEVTQARFHPDLFRIEAGHF